MVGRLGGQSRQAYPAGILLEIYLLAGGKEARRFHLRLQSCNRDIITRPEVRVHKKRVAFAREARVIRAPRLAGIGVVNGVAIARSEEHTSELQSLAYLVCRLLL